MLKKRSRFKAIDFIIFFSCLAGAFISGALFWREYNHTLVKLNEEPVGIIIFKKHVAQRKFIDRGVWDRLKQASPIYNGDTIRTIEQSEAIIILQDETTSLSLYDSTMIQVFFNNQGGASIDFSGGNIEVVSENKNTVISSGASTIVVGGQVRMNKSEEGFILSVVDGQAVFDGAEIEAGNILSLDSGGKIDIRPVITMISHSPSAADSESAGAVPIVFSWNAFHFNPDTYVIIETAIDRGFNQIIETRDVRGASSAAIPLKKGNYWWRAYPVDGGSRKPANWFYPSGTLEVVPAAAAELAFSDESPIPPLAFGRNTQNWNDLDAETIANNNRILSNIVLILNTHSEYRLRVEGHANSVINPGDTAGRRREQAQELLPMSEIRARAVADQLVKLGVDPNRLEYYGLGGERPVAAWEDKDNWRMNRRVELILFKPD